MISRKTLKERIRKKTNPSLAETIKTAMKNEKWLPVARVLSGPTRKQTSLNLYEIDERTKAGDSVLVLGKVLSQGELTKKIVICGLSASEKAKQKIKESKSEFVYLIDEIKKNQKAEGVKILQ